MEFVIGGAAAMGASVFTNPIEVVKHHMELSKKAHVTAHKYKNVIHVGYNVVKADGLKSLQKGLSPALGAHLISYGMKLGTYNYAQNRGYTTNARGEVIIPKSILMSGAGGLLGQYLSNPFYLLKIQHEVYSKQTTPCGGEKYYVNTVRKIFNEQGIRGFFKGATASLPRAFIGTSQLTSFALAKENIRKFEVFANNKLLTTLVASVIAGVVLSVAMTPFDFVLTKLYKQAINPKSVSQVYEGFLDCLRKTYMKQGLRPFYSGICPLFMKLGPHTMLCLVFWEEFKDMYANSDIKYAPLYSQNQQNQGIYDKYFTYGNSDLCQY